MAFFSNMLLPCHLCAIPHLCVGLDSAKFSCHVMFVEVMSEKLATLISAIVRSEVGHIHITV